MLGMCKRNINPDIAFSGCRTLKQWNSIGYKVSKGSRHVGRNAQGVCVFSANQVELFKPNKPLFNNTVSQYRPTPAPATYPAHDDNDNEESILTVDSHEDSGWFTADW